MTSKKSIIYYKIGKNLLEEGKVREALEAFEIAIFEEPGFRKAKEAYDSTFAELETEPSLTSSLTERIKEKIESHLVGEESKTHYYLGKLYYFEGDYLSALDELATALKQAESDRNLTVDILNLIGSIYYVREELELLLEYANRALEMDGQSAGAFFNKGLWYKMSGLFEEAKDAFQRAITLNRHLFHAYDELGELHINDGNYQKAEEIFKKILDIIPDWLNSYFALGEIALRKGNPQLSLSYFKRALEILPEDERLLSKLGKVYNMAGDPANAILCLEHLLKSGSAAEDDLMNLGVAHLLLMMPTTALEVFTKLRDVHPYHPMLLEFIVLSEMMEQSLSKLQELPASLRENMGLGPEIVLETNQRRSRRTLYLPLSSQTTLSDFSHGKKHETPSHTKESSLEFLKSVLLRPEENIGFILSLLRSKNAVNTLTQPTVKEKIVLEWPEKEKDQPFITTVAGQWKNRAKTAGIGKEMKIPDLTDTKELIVLHKDDIRLDYFFPREFLDRYRRDGRKKWIDITTKELCEAVPLKKVYILVLFPEFLKR